MRYEVQHLPGRGWTVFDHAKNHAIEASDGLLLESAAHIIAFALNAVADGLPLTLKRDGRVIKYYNGPTEGVAS